MYALVNNHLEEFGINPRDPKLIKVGQIWELDQRLVMPHESIDDYFVLLYNCSILLL
jgi:hypothetical protein